MFGNNKKDNDPVRNSRGGTIHRSSALDSNTRNSRSNNGRFSKPGDHYNGGTNTRATPWGKKK